MNRDSLKGIVFSMAGLARNRPPRLGICFVFNAILHILFVFNASVAGKWLAHATSINYHYSVT